MTSTEDKLDLKSSRAAKKLHNEIVAWTKSNFQAIRNARVQAERQWYLNLAFYFGKQNVALLRPQTGGLGVGTSTRLWVPPAPYYRVRPVINRIRPTIRHELAQLTNNKPSASIVPSSAEDRDMYAAMAGEQVWENIYIDKKLKFIIRRSVWWSLVCGTGFIKTWWDPSKGDSVEYPDGSTGKLGDISVCSETPFHVLAPDFREEEIEEQPFIIHAQSKSIEWVRMNYAKNLQGQTLNPATEEAGNLIEDSFLSLVGAGNIDKQKNVLVLEVWVKPGAHPLFPRGAFYTMVGDQIVQGQEGFPYSHGQYPFAKIDHIPAGKFYSTSSIEDLIPLQKEYNRTRGQIIEAKNRMAKPQLVAPRGSVDASKITTEPGLVIFYTPGFEPPKPIPLAALPAYVIQELDRIKLDWDDISGQHDVSKGQVPPGVTAATAISYLQERDESKLSPTFDSIEEAIEKTARHALVYVKDYWDVERIVKITGPDGSFDVMAFKGSDLKDNVDIRIEGGSSLPVSKAAKQALLMDLMKMGFITPQQGLEQMDMGGLNKIYERLQVDRKQAQRENMRMSKVTPELIAEHEAQAMQAAIMEQQMNPPLPEEMEISMETGELIPPEPTIPLIVPVNTWDNHKVHIEYHNEFRKGQAFENLPEEAKTLFEEHVNQHIEAMGLEMMTQNPAVVAGVPMPPPGEEDGGGEEQQQPTNPIDTAIAGGQEMQQPGQPGPETMPENIGGQF